VIDSSLSKEMQSLLYDPQTAGGLLVCSAEERADELLQRLQQTYPQAAIIGSVAEHNAQALVVK
jgi:selenide,water dikinase